MGGVHDFIRVPPRTIVCLKEPWLVPPARIALRVWFNEPSSLVLGGLRRTIPAAIARVTSDIRRDAALIMHECQCLATGRNNGDAGCDAVYTAAAEAGATASCQDTGRLKHS